MHPLKFNANLEEKIIKKRNRVSKTEVPGSINKLNDHHLSNQSHIVREKFQIPGFAVTTEGRSSTDAAQFKTMTQKEATTARPYNAKRAAIDSEKQLNKTLCKVT